MYLEFGPDSVFLNEPSDTTTLYAVIDPRMDRHTVEALLAREGLGRLQPGDKCIQVEIKALRRLAMPVVEIGWDDDFAAMVHFARSKGWVDAEYRSVRVHVTSLDAERD